jgi:Kef-type K+ transport system membrane component KefB
MSDSPFAAFLFLRASLVRRRAMRSVSPTLMNARGLMQLILLNIGLQRGLNTPTLFTILVMMAIATTVMAYPLFGRGYRINDRELDHLAVKPA